MDNRFDSKEKGSFRRMGIFGRGRERDLHISKGDSLLYGIGWAITALLLGLCRLPFSVYPLGMALLCASDTYLGFTIAGLAVSAFFLPIPWGIYLSVIGLTLVARILTRLFVDIPIRSREIVGLGGMLEHIHGRLFCESLYLRMTSSCVAVFLLSLYAIVVGGFRYYDLFGAFFSMIVAPVATFFYCSFSGDMPLSTLWLSRVRRLAKSLLAFSLCLSFGGMEFSGFSLGMAATFVATLLLCREEGVVLGLFTSVICGLTCGWSYFAIFPVVAITAFCLFEVSPYLSAIVSAVVGGVTGVLLVGKDRLLAIFFPIMLGAAVYCSLEKLLAGHSLSSIFHKKEGVGHCELLRLEKQSTHASSSMGGLCQTLALLSEDLSCVDGAGSFSASYKNISKAFLGVLEGITSQYREDEKRTVAVRDKLRELGFDALETVVCGERASRIFISGLSPIPDRKRLLYLQKQLGRALDCSLSLPTLSLDESGCLLYAERAHCFDVRAGVAMESCEGISGDTVRVFEDSGNHYSYVLICDGMGSGQEAALTSGVSAKMLERLLVSGVPVEEALGMLNGLLSFGRSSDAEISTTVDLLCLDKLTGRAVFLKSGASPTYVKRGTNIFKLTGASMPMGILSLVDVKRLEFDTCDGDMIVQSSDGVTAGENECLWLLEYLNETDESDPERMAEHIKREAVQKGSVDDVSVVVTKIHQKF